ncbi:MAG: hypothetical protein ABI873_01720 [Marmoricola sp.]
MPNNLQFVSWSRRGAAVGNAVDPAQPDGRLHVSRTFGVTSRPKGGAATTVPAESAKVTVLGPGDVVGLDRSQILRRCPRPDDHNLEPNYLAAIEFAHPDLPWMFSPQVGAGEKAQPWLMLLAIPDESGQVITPAGIGKPCPVLTLTGAEAAHDPKKAWAFAHVQAQGAADAATAVRWVSELSNQAAVRSRVLCPTRLHPGTGYVAALVPAYEIGRLAGLDQPIPDGTGAALWTPGAGLQLPVYDSWRFWTGPSGDFETLAKKLHRVDPEVMAVLGVRKVAIEAKAALMQPQGPEDDAFSGVYDVPTAITRIETEALGAFAPDLADPDARALELHTRLKHVVDLVAGASKDNPMVGPPLYGQWPALVTSLDGNPGDAALAPVAAATSQTWIEQLNADPYLRAAAGLATLVVQHDQEELMTDAWTQLEQLQAANARIRWASLYAHTTVALHDRVAALTPGAALRLLSPATGRLRQSADLTFRATIDASTVPREALGSALARTARYAVRATARAAEPAAGAPVVSTTAIVGNTLEALRTSAEGAVPARYTRAREIDQSLLDDLVGDQMFVPRLTERLATDPVSYLERVRDVPNAIDRLAARLVVQPAAPVVGAGEGTRVQLRPEALKTVIALTKLARAAEVGGHIELSTQVRDEMAMIGEHGVDRPISLNSLAILNDAAVRFQQQGAAEKVQRLDLDVDAQAVHLDRGGAGDSALRALGIPPEQVEAAETVVALRTATLTDFGIPELRLDQFVAETTTADSKALRRMIDQVQQDTTPTGGPVATPELARLDLGIAAKLVAKLEPLTAYQEMLAFAYEFADGVVRRESYQFHPAMASPLFPKPAVERLKSLDEEWVLGGMRQLEPNSVCLLGVNWRFVESFLAGANHEMARELLWRGYPTDLRGTCFRRFWNGPSEDILAMDHWNHAIGAHRAPDAPKDFTVLLVKGDLLRRYPSTIIAAELGTASKEGEEVSFTSEDHRPELFRGFLGQDISYVAIDVKPDELLFRDQANVRHCWYISLAEPHEEPRFGLDEKEGVTPGSNGPDPDSWSWEGLPDPSLPHLDPDAVKAALSSGRVGSNLFQRPFRMLLRARDYV